MIPVDVTLQTPTTEKKYHFEVIENPLLTPTLVAVTTFNGIVGSPAYGEGSTLQLEGEIDVKDHSPVRISDLFAPTDNPVPAGMFVATDVQAVFAKIYSNPYEPPRIEAVHIHVVSQPDRREATIDGAWLDKVDARPGDTVAVKVQLRPYRGPSFVQEIPITIPAQAVRGQLQLVISDSNYVNRNVEAAEASSQGQLPGLEQLIRLINLERQNDRLYATLLQPTPTLMVEDKIMPNAPASEINVLDQRQNPTGARLTFQSTAGEWSVRMRQVISGERTLTITVNSVSPKEIRTDDTWKTTRGTVGSRRCDTRAALRSSTLGSGASPNPRISTRARRTGSPSAAMANLRPRRSSPPTPIRILHISGHCAWTRAGAFTPPVVPMRKYSGSTIPQSRPAVFQSGELSAQAIVFDSHDNLFVGTSPDGKVYKVTPDGQQSIFFDPKAKYIWALAIDPQGDLFVGTGDKGEIFAVAPDGTGKLFYQSDERHARSLAFDGEGNLLVGTDPDGLILRIAIAHKTASGPAEAGASFVIYETNKKEVTSLVTRCCGKPVRRVDR